MDPGCRIGVYVSSADVSLKPKGCSFKLVWIDITLVPQPYECYGMSKLLDSVECSTGYCVLMIS